jgi:hypothetical protein
VLPLAIDIVCASVSVVTRNCHGYAHDSYITASSILIKKSVSLYKERGRGKG